MHFIDSSHDTAPDLATNLIALARGVFAIIPKCDRKPADRMCDRFRLSPGRSVR